VSSVGAADTGSVAELRRTSTIRTRASRLLERALAGGSRWFTIDEDRLATTADAVADTCRSRYPQLAIPYHSRWRHFEAGAVDRKAQLDHALADYPIAEKARAAIDLTVVSVLLDAGAGPRWAYREEQTGLSLTRSEGLGVASWHAFADGVFSSDPEHPLRVDAHRLRELSETQLARAFQVRADNPLVGLGGRVALLHRLGDAMAGNPHTFGPLGRPGGLFDILAGADAVPTAIRAHDILTELLVTLSGIWLTANTIGSQALGDCWRHNAVAGAGATKGWMPFHKLSQWLTYSLLEPFEWTGVTVTDLDELTGLPEYRNGGLFIDTGVLALRDPSTAQHTWAVGDEVIVEWRALTVALLDVLAPMVRATLGVDAASMPLARVLEGGTWATGRQLAAQRREGLPPLTIDSDGTVF